MSEKHTPSPWQWTEGDEPTHSELHESRYSPGDANSILYHGADWPITEANMQLIKALPELLEACKHAAKSEHHPHCRFRIGKGQCTCHVAKAQFALAKAVPAS